MKKDTIEQRFAHHLRRVRLLKGVTQAVLAERTGLTIGYISLIELGERAPSIDTMSVLTKALGVDPVEMVKGIG